MIRPDERRGVWKPLYRLLVLLAVGLGWVIFRAPDLLSSVRYIGHLIPIHNDLTISNNFIFYSREYIVFIIVAVIASTPILQIIDNKLKDAVPRITGILSAVVNCSLFIFSVSYLVMGAHNPFIYFNF